MDGLRARVRSLLAGLRRHGRLQSDMEAEFRLHIELHAERLVASGVSRADALRRARLTFGSPDRYAEEGRAARGLGVFDGTRGDVRYAVRSLRRSPAFALVAVATLALGIGATTAIFSVVHQVLLRPLPFPEPDRLVTLWERSETGVRVAVAEANFDDWRAASRSFAALAFHWNPEYQARQTVLGGDEAARVWITAVSESFFDVLGTRAQFGRLLGAEEHEQDGPARAVVSHAFWRDQLGGDPGVLGRTLDMLGTRYEVIGVLPAGFHYPAATDVWVSIRRWGVNPHRGAKNNAAIGRLHPGIAISDAQRELDRIGAALIEQHGAGAHAAGAVATSLHAERVGSLRQPLLLLLGAAALLLLIACTNLASTLLARAGPRQRELAIRAAIGARRGRLVRQLLTESLVLALAGTAAGLALAVMLLRAFDAIRPATLDPVTGFGIHAPVLGFALLLAVTTTLLFGLLPALRTAPGAPGDALRSGARGNAAAGTTGGWGALVAVEVALAVVLLVGSGLLLRSFIGVLGQTPGFETDNVLTAEVALPSSRYADDAALIRFYDRALSDLSSLPGVVHAGLIQHVPLGGVSWSGDFDIEGRGAASGPAGYRVVGPGYFRALGIPVLQGRDFDQTDRADAPHVALVNQSLADREWPGLDPIGRRIGNLANEPMKYRGEGDWLTIVGVVADVRQTGLLDPAMPEIYVNVMQHPDRARTAVLTLRTAVPPTALIAPVRGRLRALDAQVPVEFTTMSARVTRSVADRRFSMLVLGLFALLALVLAAVGIFGVVSYAVARRTREIGIRLALGAPPASVRALVQRRTMSFVLAGAAAGSLGALALARLLQGLLWGVRPADPLTFAAVVAALVTVAYVASYIPARRTTRVDPLLTMKAE